MSEYIVDGRNIIISRQGKTPHWTEIVRCRDCKHYTLEGAYKFDDGSTNADFCEYIRGWLLQVNPDGFCAWGVKK